MNDARQVIGRSVIAGVIASVAMGMFAMVASETYQDTGFFTPPYHIASLVLPPDTMMESATAGTTFTFAAGPAERAGGDGEDLNRPGSAAPSPPPIRGAGVAGPDLRLTAGCQPTPRFRCDTGPHGR